VLCRTCRFALVAAAPAASTSAQRRAIPGEAPIVALPYTGRARQVLLGFKYHNRRQVAGHLAGLLVNRLVAAGVRPVSAAGPIGAGQVDIVTWAPTSARRRRARGFDQSELIARRVAAQLGLPCRRLLERNGDATPQTGRARVHRLHTPEFSTRPGLTGRRVLVIDDVVTTGATLRGAAAALRSAGAAQVVVAAVAMTPSGTAGRVRGRAA